MLLHLDLLFAEFLSTPSARRATSLWAYGMETSRDFYPRPPRGGRLPISCIFAAPTLFLSTPSARRATRLHSEPCYRQRISIHALREEGDSYV